MSQIQNESNKQKIENTKMQNKAQMGMGKLVIFLLGLTVIWVLCSRAQNQFQARFEDDTMGRMGGHAFNSTKLNLALQVKANASQQSVLNATKTVDQMYTKIYNLGEQKEEQLICVVIRDFDKVQNYQHDYITARSILRQEYKNYHILYVSEENDPSKDKVRSYLTVNQVLEDKYTFVTAFVDTIDALFRASEKCPQNAILLLLENGQRLTSSLALKVISSHFVSGVQLTWANSLYANDKLGFSFDYKEDIKQKKEFRKYPLAINDVVAFRNSLFIKNRSSFQQHRLYYPLYMAESFGFTLLAAAEKFRYIPEILTFKEKNYRLRVDRSSLEKQLEQLIRQDKPILGLLKSVANAESK